MRNPLELLLRCVLIIGSVALLETVFRVLPSTPPSAKGGEWHFEYDANKNYRWKANLHGEFGTMSFTTNAQHRVGGEFPEAKPVGTRRLAVLGDSVSFGFNVPYEESFVPLLEKALHVDALNFGVPGYSTFQEYYDLREAEKYCPDVKLLQFSYNDLVEPFVYLKRLGGLGIDYHRVPDASGLHFWMRQHSKVYEFFSDQFVATAVQSYGVEESRRALERTQEFDERDLFENPTGEHGRAAWSEFHYWLRKMSAECHGDCAFLLSPNAIRFYKASEAHERTLAALKARVEAEGFTFLDPWPAITAALAKSGEKDPVKRWNTLFLDNIHPNARGHAVLAGFLEAPLRAMLQRPAKTCSP